jgi:hypothetical protein
MPISTLRFTLPQEDEEHYDAIHGAEYRHVIHEMQDWLRSQIKYDISDDDLLKITKEHAMLQAKCQEILQVVQQRLNSFILERDLK